MKRFLCICEAGTVRSGAMAFVLRLNYGQDAIAYSARWGTEDTTRMLCEWADYIVVMQPKFASVVPEGYKSRIRIADVGPDRWMNPLAPALQDKVESIAAKWAAKGFEIEP